MKFTKTIGPPLFNGNAWENTSLFFVVAPIHFFANATPHIFIFLLPVCPPIEDLKCNSPENTKKLYHDYWFISSNTYHGPYKLDLCSLLGMMSSLTSLALYNNSYSFRRIPIQVLNRFIDIHMWLLWAMLLSFSQIPHWWKEIWHSIKKWLSNIFTLKLMLIK